MNDIFQYGKEYSFGSYDLGLSIDDTLTYGEVVQNGLAGVAGLEHISHRVHHVLPARGSSLRQLMQEILRPTREHSEALPDGERHFGDEVQLGVEAALHIHTYRYGWSEACQAQHSTDTQSEFRYKDNIKDEKTYYNTYTYPVFNERSA